MVYRSSDGSLRVRSLLVVPCIVRRTPAAVFRDDESPVAPPEAMRASCLRARSCSALRRDRCARTSAKSGRSWSSLAYLLATLASLTYQSTKALASYLFWLRRFSISARMPAAEQRCRLKLSRSGCFSLMAAWIAGIDRLFGVPFLRPPRRSPGRGPRITTFYRSSQGVLGSAMDPFARTDVLRNSMKFRPFSQEGNRCSRGTRKTSYAPLSRITQIAFCTRFLANVTVPEFDRENRAKISRFHPAKTVPPGARGRGVQGRQSRSRGVRS
jgi:hypothetical protein